MNMYFSTNPKSLFKELLEDAVEEMSEDLALPIAIVLIVGFLGNKSFKFNELYFFIKILFMFLSYFMHGNRHLVLRHPRFHRHRCHSPGSKILISHPRNM